MQRTQFRILIDLDGVVANWLGKAIKTFGLNARSPIIKDLLMWDVINAGGADWWADIETFPWSNYLFNRMSNLGRVCFLTQPSEHGSSADGKVRWITKHFNTRDYLLGRPKEMCAGRYSFLIDDTPKKIAQFEEYGGWGIPFPNAFSIESDCGFAPDLISERGHEIVDALASKIEFIQKTVRDEDNERAATLFQLAGNGMISQKTLTESLLGPECLKELTS